MPELPEVETIRRALRPALLGEQITRAHVLWARTLAEPPEADFFQRLPGRTVQELGRRGKFLILHLDLGALLIHLRMSGDLLMEQDSGPFGPHHRLALDFSSGKRLSFNDPRKFGRVWLVDDPQQALSRLGPEPLDDSFTPEQLNRMLHGVRRQLKPLLLDQSFLAGLGNIYTDEALHLSRLHPLTPSNQLSPEQSARLWGAIRQVLQEGIRRNGASIDWVYRGGDFQNYFRAYGRKGEACPECGQAIVRLVVGQRGTYICPHCQKLP